MILITGATGFVGRHLVNELYKKRYRIRCLVRDTRKAAHARKSDIDLGDMTDSSSLLKAAKGCSVVIHLAAPIGHDDYKTNYEVTVKGMENLVEACRRNNVKRIIFLSSVGVLVGSNYGKTKLMAEDVLKKSGLGYTILRGDWIYGYGDSSLSRLAMLFRKFPFIPVPGDGSYRKRPIYVGDAVKAIMRCINGSKTMNKTYMLGGPHITYNEMLRIFCTRLGIEKKMLHLPRMLFFLMAALMEPLGIRLITRNNILGLTYDCIYSIEEMKKDLVEPISFEKGLEKCVWYYK